MTTTLTPDPKIEQWLLDKGIAFELVDLDLDRIDAKASTTNQARDLPVDPDLVDRYAADMAAGDVFPPVVARTRARSSKVVLVGGNHRHHAAAKAKVDSLPAYLIDVEPEMALRLAIEDNRRHGKQCSTDEAVGHALHLIALGVTIADAARTAGVSPALITQRQASAEANKRAADLGVIGIEALPVAVRYQLSQIQADPVFTAAAQSAVDHQMTGPQVTEMRKEISKARSERDALRAVGEHTEAAQDAAQQRAGAKAGRSGGRAGANARVTMLRRISDLMILSSGDVRMACADGGQRAEARRRLKECAQHLMEIDKVLAK